MSSSRTVYVLAVYLCDRAYGGPEEGGWWYDTGELVRIIRVLKSEHAADARCARLNRLLGVTLNRGRRPKSSVLSDGIFEAKVCESFAPERYPARRPHYE